VRIITTILYSIICTTCDKNTIDILALSLGANATKPDRRRRYLNGIAIGIIKDFSEEIARPDDATATTRTAPLFQSSQSNDSLQSRQPQVVPSAITTNHERDSTKALGKKINPMKCSRAVVDATSNNVVFKNDENNEYPSPPPPSKRLRLYVSV
jgi:hypothetical protein